MQPEIIFLLSNGLAAVGWFALLVLSPLWKDTDKLVMGVVVVLLAGIYTWVNLSHLGDAGGLTAFFSYDGVLKVFQSPYLVTAAWAHILAVDLLAATWMCKNAQSNNIPHWMLIPVLLLTLVLGPLGIIAYLLLRWVRTGQYFGDYFA